MHLGSPHGLTADFCARWYRIVVWRRLIDDDLGSIIILGAANKLFGPWLSTCLHKWLYVLYFVVFPSIRGKPASRPLLLNNVSLFGGKWHGRWKDPVGTGKSGKFNFPSSILGLPCLYSLLLRWILMIGEEDHVCLKTWHFTCSVVSKKCIFVLNLCGFISHFKIPKPLLEGFVLTCFVWSCECFQFRLSIQFVDKVFLDGTRTKTDIPANTYSIIYMYITPAHECKILQLRISKLKERMHIRNYQSILRVAHLRGIVVFRLPCLLRPVKGWYDLATTGSSHDPRRSARPGVTGHATQQRDAVSCRNEGCGMMRARVPSGHKHPSFKDLKHTNAGKKLRSHFHGFLLVPVPGLTMAYMPSFSRIFYLRK